MMEGHMATEDDNDNTAQALVEEIVRRMTFDTRKPAVSFVPEESVKPDLLGSFLGGDSYWSPGGVPVTAEDGSPLYPLAQIRCSDLDLPGYPTQGLLQFLIGTDSLYGCDLSANYDSEAENGNRCVRYIPTVPEVLASDEVVTLPHIERSSDNSGQELFTPFDKDFHGCALRAEHIEEAVNHECDEFDPAYERVINQFDPEMVAESEGVLGDVEQAVIDRMSAESAASWIQVGGYPVFT
ncbi:DUF1963 domain-containing protein [Bifidobacterium reuteri]|uniref:DUF1963 domain-containing protein n=1 Tax=Bifidobacterium reuteri TaxID=983706 RepID=A0A5J5E9M0_9BIFI|nr:DUF1963 domain-containing protein [Bifidobacterium reuteri]